MAKKCKPFEICWWICDVYKEACFHIKIFYKWAKLFKESQNNIQDEDKPGRPTMASIPEMVNSVNAFIFPDRRIYNKG